jgi:hypothetical protein
VTIDRGCKDISRLRGYSFDNDAYFNHFTNKFNLVLKKKTIILLSNYFQTNNSESTKIVLKKILMHYKKKK